MPFNSTSYKETHLSIRCTNVLSFPVFGLRIQESAAFDQGAVEALTIRSCAKSAASKMDRIEKSMLHNMTDLFLKIYQDLFQLDDDDDDGVDFYVYAMFFLFSDCEKLCGDKSKPLHHPCPDVKGREISRPKPSASLRQWLPATSPRDLAPDGH